MRAPLTHATVEVNFARVAGPPLSKDRIGVFNSGLVTIDRYERDERFFQRTTPESCRVDLGWGADWMPWSREVVELDERGEPRYHFEETDSLARFLLRNGVQPYWAYCYVPSALRRDGLDWRSMDVDDSGWVDLVREYVRTADPRGAAPGYHEIYNEPDIRADKDAEPVFYTGTLEDYLDLYRAAATAIREMDPQARIGGPAIGLTQLNTHWLRALLEVAQTEDLPLDFLSFHHYDSQTLSGSIGAVLDVLAEFQGFDELELHLNEYNSFAVAYPRGAAQDKVWMASAFAADIPRLLEYPVARTHWAQFLDSGNGNFSGMVDIDGKPKHIYWVYEFYQGMPLDQCEVLLEGPAGVGAIASADGDAGAVMLWNRHFLDVEISLDLGRFAGDAEIDLVAADGIVRAARSGVDASSIVVPRGGVALVRCGSPREVLRSRHARVVKRVNRRRHLIGATSWADVDEFTGEFRFGVNDSAVLTIGAELDISHPLDLDGALTDAAGSPLAGGAAVLVETPGSQVETILGDGPIDVDWASVTPDRPVPSQTQRVTAVLGNADPGTFAKVKLLASQRDTEMFSSHPRGGTAGGEGP